MKACSKKKKIKEEHSRQEKYNKGIETEANYEHF